MMKFAAKELELARDQLYRNIVDYFVDRKGIMALYLQGSVAENSADEFSDLDFRVVVELEAYQKYIAERFDAPKRWGDWIYNEWAGSGVCVSHFKPFNKVDVLYFHPEQIKPSAWFQLPTKVIYDSNNLIQKVVRDSQEQDFDISTTGEIERLISKGLAYSEEVYRRVTRGELCYAQSQLDSLRSVLIQFDDYLHQDLVSSGFGSPAHFEQRGSKALVEVLKLSYSSMDRWSILQALNILLEHYKIQVEQLYQKFPLKRSLDTDLQWIEVILELSNSH